jgi:membrane protein DedA with SNARE-associated domain
MPVEQIQIWITHYGYAAIFCLLALGIVGLPVPDETLLTLTGFLIFKGSLHPIPAYLSALGGTVVGISISYGIGNVGGTRVLRRFGQQLHIGADRVQRVQTWFDKRGKWTLLVGYFVPGVRHIVALVAGSTGLPYAPFAQYSYAGAVLWSASFVAAGYYFGEGWASFPQLMRFAGLSFLVLAVFATFAYGLYRRRSAR